MKQLTIRYGGLLFALSLFSQIAGAQTKPLAFEVVSIKIAEPMDRSKMMGQPINPITIDAARVTMSNATLSDLINRAFNVRSYQVDGPQWLKARDGQRFNLQATMPAGTTKEQVPEMLQTMLRERFALAFHREEKEQPVFALIVAKNGPKLKDPLSADPAAPSGSKSSVAGNIVHLEQDMDMPALCEMATRFVDRPVLDMTQLAGRYRVAIDLSTDDMRTIASRNGNPTAMETTDAAADPTGGTIFESMSKMGLKLDPRKMAVNHVVIEKLEKLPTEN